MTTADHQSSDEQTFPISFKASRMGSGGAQLEEAANLLQRKRQTADGEGQSDAIPHIQVLLSSSRAFGPTNLRELTVRAPY